MEKKPQEVKLLYGWTPIMDQTVREISGPVFLDHMRLDPPLVLKAGEPVVVTVAVGWPIASRKRNVQTKAEALAVLHTWPIERLALACWNYARFEQGQLPPEERTPSLALIDISRTSRENRR